MEESYIRTKSPGSLDSKSLEESRFHFLGGWGDLAGEVHSPLGENGQVCLK